MRAGLVKLTSVWALLKIQPDDAGIRAMAAPLLVTALDSDRELARAEASAALGELGPLAKPAIPRA